MNDDKIDFNEILLEHIRWYEEEATEEEKQKIDKKIIKSLNEKLEEIKERNRRSELAWYAREGKRYTI